MNTITLDSIERTAEAEGLGVDRFKQREAAYRTLDIVAQRIHGLRVRIASEKARQPGSIHPRGRMDNGKYKNTCAKKDKDVTRRKIAAIQAHVERTGDRVPMQYLNKLQASL